MNIAFFLPVLSALFWSGNFVLGRAVANDIPPIALNYWRWSLALMLLLPFVIRPMWRQRQLIRAHFWSLTALSVVGIAGFNSFAYMGLQDTTATNGLLINSMIPIFIIIISRFWLNKPISVMQLSGVGVSFCGVMFLLSQGELSTLLKLSFNNGDLWVMGAALIWAIYSIGLKWKPAELSALAFLGFSVLVGSSFLAPIYWLDLTAEPQWQLTQNNMLAIGYTAVFPSIVAYLCWNQGVKLIGPSLAGQFIHLMPLFGTLLAVLFIGEQLALFQLVGALLIAGGIYLSIKPAKQQVRLKRSENES